MPKTTPAKSSHPRSRRIWIGLLTAVLITLVAGALAWNSGLLPGRPINNATEQQAYTQPITQLDLTVDSGDITIRAGDVDKISIERHLKWVSAKPTSTESWDGTRLHLTGTCPGNQLNCSQNYVITVPTSTTIVTKTDAGSVDIAGISSNISITTKAGDVQVAGTQGQLKIDVEDGTVTATDTRSTNVTVETTSGNIALDLATAPEQLTATTDAGDIDVQLPADSAYAVQANTVDGTRNVAVRQDSTSPHRITVQTTAGNVTVR